MTVKIRIKNVVCAVGILTSFACYSQNVLKLDTNSIQVENTSFASSSVNSNQVIKLENQVISLNPSLILSAIIQDKAPKFSTAEISKPEKITSINRTKLSYSEKDLLINTSGTWNQVASFNSNQFGKIRHISGNTSSSVIVFTESKAVLFDFVRSKVLKSVDMPKNTTNGNIFSNDGIIVISNKGLSYTFDRKKLKFSKFSESEIEEISMVSAQNYLLVEKKSDQNTFNISYKNIKKGVIASEKQIGDNYRKKPLLSTHSGKVWVATENRLEMLNLDGIRNGFCFQFTRDIKSIQNVADRIELIFSDGGKFGMTANVGNSDVISVVSDDSEKNADLKNRFVFDSGSLFVSRSDKLNSDSEKKSSFAFDKFDRINSALPQSDYLVSNLKCSWCQVVGSVYDRKGSEFLKPSDFAPFLYLLNNSKTIFQTRLVISSMRDVNA